MTDSPKTASLVVHLTYGAFNAHADAVVDHVLVTCTGTNAENTPASQKVAVDAGEVEFNDLPPDTYTIVARAHGPEKEGVRGVAHGTPDAAAQVTIDGGGHIDAIHSHRIPRGHVPQRAPGVPFVALRVPVSLTVMQKDSEEHRHWYQRRHEAAPQEAVPVTQVTTDAPLPEPVQDPVVQPPQDPPSQP